MRQYRERIHFQRAEPSLEIFSIARQPIQKLPATIHRFVPSKSCGQFQTIEIRTDAERQGFGFFGIHLLGR